MGDFREGFLCPICMADLGDDIQLTVHFDEKHSREDPVIVQNLKELFSKAKKKIGKPDQLQQKSDLLENVPQEFSKEFYGMEPWLYHPVSGIHYDILDGSDNGIETIDKFDQFRLERAKRADIRAMDINKLIVRLERLMTQLPSDPVKRRSHEQAVVPWIDEKDVSLCPGCAKSFGMTRRRHHCRLCGGIMCADCSDLVSFELAERLINPATISKFNNQPNEKASPSKSKAQATYDGLMSNLVDLAGFAESQRNFRSCLHCKEVLDKRDLRLSIKTAPDPELVKYYSHLQKLLVQGSEMGERYRKMAASLHNGESTYQLEEVKVLRLHVLKAAETVDAVSKKIASLPVLDPKTETLQNRIRISAVNFVKETLVGLPSAPTPEEFEKIKIQKAQEATKRIEEEKKNAAEAKLKVLANSASSSPALASFEAAQNMISRTVTNSRKQLKFPTNKKSEVRMIGQGFVASADGLETFRDDPLGQQIFNLKKFIKQAKDAGQFDDARILETNLRDLQEEYKKVKLEERSELEQNYQEFKGLFGKNEKDGNNPFYEHGSSNPFGEDDEDANNPFKGDNEDDYDSSGKNPFGTA